MENYRRHQMGWNQETKNGNVGLEVILNEMKRNAQKNLVILVLGEQMGGRLSRPRRRIFQ